MDAVVLVPLDTGCILRGTAGRRWRGEREQPGSKCCSLSVLKCWSWTSGRSTSLAQVGESWLLVIGPGLGEGCGGVKADCEDGGVWDAPCSPDGILRLPWTFH